MTIDIDAIRAQTVDDFNSLYGVGTWVRYWTGTRQDPARDGQTRSKAELLGGHTPVVWVTGHGACIALTHVDAIPDQPDGIEGDSHDLPDPARAAERVREYIASNGDGIYDVTDGNPLYARDLEALRRAGEEIGRLRAENDELRRHLGEAVDVLTNLGWSADADRLAAALNQETPK